MSKHITTTFLNVYATAHLPNGISRDYFHKWQIPSLYPPSPSIFVPFAISCPFDWDLGISSARKGAPLRCDAFVSADIFDVNREIGGASALRGVRKRWELYIGLQNGRHQAATRITLENTGLNRIERRKDTVSRRSGSHALVRFRWFGGYHSPVRESARWRSQLRRRRRLFPCVGAMRRSDIVQLCC